MKLLYGRLPPDEDNESDDEIGDDPHNTIYPLASHLRFCCCFQRHADERITRCLYAHSTILLIAFSSRREHTLYQSPEPNKRTAGQTPDRAVWVLLCVMHLSGLELALTQVPSCFAFAFG